MGEAETRYFVTYMGSGVAELKGAGLFQSGTSAFVGEEAARAALDSGGKWQVLKPDGTSVGALPAPPKSAIAAPPPAPARASVAAPPERKPEPPEAEEKKPTPPKAEKKKPEEKKAEEKKPEEKKAEEKKG